MPKASPPDFSGGLAWLRLFADGVGGVGRRVRVKYKVSQKGGRRGPVRMVGIDPAYRPLEAGVDHALLQPAKRTAARPGSANGSSTAYSFFGRRWRVPSGSTITVCSSWAIRFSR